MLNEEEKGQHERDDEDEDPLKGLFEDGFEPMIKHQRHRGEECKTRAQKKKQKIQKLTKDLNDPQMRKERNMIRHQAEKAKLHAILGAMKTQEEVKKYLIGLKIKSKQLKLKVRNNMATGMPILVDLVFEEKMNEKENRSLAKQLKLIMKLIKHVEDPPSIYLCNFQGGITEQLDRMGYKFWPLTTSLDSVAEVGATLQKKLIYLSPDAPLPLESIDKDSVFILGGLIDRTIIKFTSLNRAKELGIEARKLPICQFMKNRIVLNLDHVVMMLCKFRQTGDWKTAFDFAAPKRWKKEEFYFEGPPEKAEEEQGPSQKLEEEPGKHDSHSSSSSSLQGEEAPESSHE